jgi:hypothetical protein
MEEEKNFKWTNSLVKMFVKIINGKFNSTLIDRGIFDTLNYKDKKIDEQLMQFRLDCVKLPIFKSDV